MPKQTLFASQKKREIRLSWVWYTILFFLFQCCCLLNTILSFQKFASITESFILYFLLSFSPFLVSSFASCVIFLTLSIILCLLGVILGVTLTVILGFTQSYRVHIIVLVTINPNLNHLSLTIKYVLR